MSEDILMNQIGSKKYGEVNQKKRPKSPKKNKIDIGADDGSTIHKHEHGIIDSIPCCKSIHNKFCFKLFIFLLLCGLDASDLVSDWLLFRDVAGTEKGLVYGPPSDTILYSLLAFSIVGSLTFIFEVVNLWWEVFRNNPWIDSDLASVITIWIEDVPQIILNVFIVICREEAISYFQLVKASVIILGAVIRVILSLVRYCSKQARMELDSARRDPESCRHVVYRVFIMVGLFLTLGGAVAIFMFTQSERNPDGTINFKIPHSVIVGKYDDEKYFHNVSVYFSHKMFDYSTPVASLADINLFRVASINDMRQETFDRRMKIQYDSETNNNTKFVFWYGNSAGSYKAAECFQIDRANKKLTIGSSCSSYITATYSELVFSFHYIQPKHPDLTFGDFQYNIKLNQMSACSDYPHKVHEDLQKHLESTDNPVLRYFQAKPHVNENKHVILTSAAEGRFYKLLDLTNISEVWKTGFGYCSSTGSVSPHYESGLSVVCP